MLLQKQIAFYLNDLDTTLGRTINLSIAVLVLVDAAIFVVETYTIPAHIRLYLDVANSSIVFFFTIEYVIRIWSAENKIKQFFSIYSIVDLMAILPFYMGILDIRFIRLFRWFRILRLIRFLDKKTLFGSMSTQDSAISVRILFTLFAIIFVYSGIIYQVEHRVNPKVFGTFLDAFYFSVVTMTTVGFGDITPISEAGRLLTVLMILTGIALIPWQLGDLIKRLVKTTGQIETICTICGLSSHDTDARFCKTCGHKLETNAESYSSS